MAKKKATKKKKGGSKKRSGNKMGINTNKLMGIAGGVFAKKKLLDTLPFLTGLDPKMKAVAIMAIGEFAPKQDFVKGFMKDQDILLGGGDAITTLGMADLLSQFGVAGLGVDDNDELAIAIEGIDDIDSISENRRFRKRLSRRSDIDVIDDDVLGDDDDEDIADDVLGDDDMDAVNDDDMDAVNDDVLGDDDDDIE